LMITSCSKEVVDESPLFDSNALIPSGSLNQSERFSGYSGSQGEEYLEYEENGFINTIDEPVSTFSIDSDGASYANVRRFLNEDEMPPKDAVRSEELINYFEMDYPYPDGNEGLKVNAEVATCPWNITNQIIRIGVRGKDISDIELPPSNFVFLIDVSGSMGSPFKIELLKESFIEFVEFLPKHDRIAIVTYSGSSNVVLNSTLVSEKNKIIEAIAGLQTGGGTNGAEGIITAYEIADANFIAGGNNRLIVATDGDFNIGVSSIDGLQTLIEEKRETGVFLSVLGFGRGNLRDGLMEVVSNNGNGTYEYIDNKEQAFKVFIDEYKKFYAAAKDVKIQVRFNPNAVLSYRLIGYENRLLENRDFEDDKKDAGELGINQTITALYEIVPNLNTITEPYGDIKYRYKDPEADFSVENRLDIPNRLFSFNRSSDNMQFATAVAGFGMLLRESEYGSNIEYDDVLEWASNSRSYDPGGWRAEFLELVEKAKSLR
ncbi:MAG: VWA domain-containing protein, partial [Bacteroidota bacterium]